MKKTKAVAAKLAIKRHKADLRRKKAQDGVARIEAIGSVNYLAAAWLATKPEGKRWELLERYATRRELMDAICEDTASHAAMVRIIECDARVFPG
jgi:predicted amino acid dehydrogenase